MASRISAELFMKPNLIAKLFRSLVLIVLILNPIRTRGRELFPSNSLRERMKAAACTGGQMLEFFWKTVSWRLSGGENVTGILL